MFQFVQLRLSVDSLIWSQLPTTGRVELIIDLADNVKCCLHSIDESQLFMSVQKALGLRQLTNMTCFAL